MKIFTLSFDDGTVQDRRLVPMLNQRGLKATFNLNSGLFGTVHDIVHEGILVNHDEILPHEVEKLYQGHEVAVHTVHHPNLRECSDARLRAEILEDKDTLEDLFAHEVCGMAYPGGHYDQRVIDIAQKCGIVYARTDISTHAFAPPDDFMIWHPTSCERDQDLFDLAERFLQMPTSAEISLFYVWAHAFELDKLHSWDRFESFLDRMAQQPDVAYMTNRQAMEACLAARTHA